MVCVRACVCIWCVCVRGGLTRGQGAVVEGGLEAHAVSVGAAGGGADHLPELQGGLLMGVALGEAMDTL